MPRLVPVLVVALALTVSGCGVPSQPPDPASPPGELLWFLSDDRSDAQSPYDIWDLGFFNLNGSFVLELVVNGTGPGRPYPFYNVSLQVEAADGGRRHVWASAEFDPERPPPGARAVAGVEGDGARDVWGVCQTFGFGEPSTIRHEVVHSRTGLVDGGTVVQASVTTSNHNGTVFDTAEASGAFALRAGANPYVPPGGDPDDHCPLLRDPSSPQYRGGG